MQPPLLFVLLILTALCLTACSGVSRDHSQYAPLLLPLPQKPLDLSDALARSALVKFLEDTGAPANSRYIMTRHDLNNDGRRDALVLLTAPYGYWCDRHGCAMLVLRAHDGHFSLINAVQPVRAPVYASETTTNDWKNLIMRVSGRNLDAARDVALIFDGERYTDKPSLQPPYLRLASSHETRLFGYY